MEEKSFFGSLFDFSFSSFVTPKLVKVLYALSLIIIVLAYLGIAVAIFGSGGTTFDPETYETTKSSNTGWGIAWLLIGGPLFALLYAVFARVLYELIIIVFRIHGTLRDELALQRQVHPEAAAALDAEVAAASGHAAPPPETPTPPAPGPPAPPPPGA